MKKLLICTFVLMAAFFAVPVHAQKSFVRPALEWTALFDRSEIWLGGDGIFTIPLDGDDTLSSAAPGRKTLFVFSDSMVGTSNPETREFKDARMVNHSAAILEGEKPDSEKIRFIYGKHGDMSRSNIFDVNCWLQDGIVIDGTLYLTGIRTGKDWKPVGIDLITVPLKDGEPDWPRFQRTEDFPIMARSDTAQACFGIGILDRSKEDGFVYVYGYRDRFEGSRKGLIAARVKLKEFSDAKSWRFWDGRAWVDDVAKTLPDEAVLADNVSAELSVTPVEGDRFMLVYTRDVMSPHIECRTGKSPVGPFASPVRIFYCPEPSEMGNGIYTYNAKAHPHLSRPSMLLISYNVNRFASLPHRTDEYRPRFIELLISFPVE